MSQHKIVNPSPFITFPRPGTLGSKAVSMLLAGRALDRHSFLALTRAAGGLEGCITGLRKKGWVIKTVRVFCDGCVCRAYRLESEELALMVLAHGLAETIIDCTPEQAVHLVRSVRAEARP